MISYQSERGTQMKNVIQKKLRFLTSDWKQTNKHIIISFNLCGQSGNGFFKYAHTHTWRLKHGPHECFQCKLVKQSRADFTVTDGYTAACDVATIYFLDGALFADISHLKNF